MLAYSALGVFNIKMSEYQHIPSYVTPLPGEQDYLSAISAVIEEYGIDDEPSLTTALQVRAITRSVPTLREFHNDSLAIAKALEPVDPIMDEPLDPKGRAAVSAYRGLGFGGLLLPHLHGGVISTSGIFDRLAGDDSEAAVTFNSHYEAAETLLRYGLDGISQAGEAVDAVLEEIEQRVIPNEKVQRYFRIGCGVVLACARLAHEDYLEDSIKDDLDDMKRALAEGAPIDWDAAMDAWEGGAQ